MVLKPFEHSVELANKKYKYMLLWCLKYKLCTIKNVFRRFGCIQQTSSGEVKDNIYTKAKI